MMTGKGTCVGLAGLTCLIGYGAAAALQSESGVSAQDNQSTTAAVDRDQERSARAAEGAVLNVRAFGAQGDGESDDTEAIQAAWDTARETGARVFVPPGEYLISLRGNAEQGYAPALRLSPGSNKEKQPILEGATRGVTLKVDFPEDAPRTQEVIHIDRGPIRDNQRGLGLRNFRLVNANEELSGTWRDPTDYYGIGIRIDSGWTGETLHNFQIRGFYVGLMVTNWYSSSAGNAEIRNCNFGICLYGTPNANRFHDIMLRGIRPVATHSESEDGSFHPKLRPEIFPGGRIGAGVYVGGGTISGAHFDSVNTEMCGTAGYYFHSVPVSFTVTNMRSEAVVAPIWIQGPISPWYTDSVTFISPSIQCTRLVGPAVYLNRARGYTFINPRFYRLESEQSQVAIEMTAGSLGNYILNPVIIDPMQKAGAAVEPGAVRPATGPDRGDIQQEAGAAAESGRYVIDNGTNNEIRRPGGRGE